MKVISATEAIARMREIRHDESVSCELHHLTYNSTTGETKGLRQVTRCRLRPALPKETYNVDTDLYLTYMDLETKKPRMCWKCLIRYVAFAPEYEIMKVNWFLN